MSLIFAESFDAGYAYPASVSYSGRYNASTSSMAAAYAQLTPGRNGNGLYMGTYVGAPCILNHQLSASEQDDLLVIGMARKIGNTTNTSFNSVVLALYGDALATTHLTFYWDASTSTIGVYRGNLSVFLGSSSVITKGVWHYIEFKVRLSDTIGTVDIRVDGANVLSLGTDTKNAGTATVFSGVGFGFMNYSGTFDIIDDLYVCNEQGAANNDWLGDIKVEALTPNGDGAHSDLTPYNYNRLPNLNVAGIETDATGWAVDTNCTISRVTTPLHSGLGSTGALQITASSAANMSVKSATGTSGAAVRGGVSYYPAVFGRANTTGRNYELGIDWYDAAGVLISRSAMTSTSADTNSAYAVKGGALATAPTNAAFASVVVQIDSPGNGEIHYIDDAYFSEANSLVDPVTLGVSNGANPSAVHNTAVNDLLVAGSASTYTDLSYLVGSTDDLVDTWTFTDPVSPSGKAVKGVVVFAQARADTLSAKSLALVARNGAGTEATSADQALSQAWPGMVSAGFDVDPSGSAWTVAAVGSAQFGVKVRP